MLRSFVQTALHSQAAALNREELEEEASKRLEGGEDGADLDRRAYMLLASPSFSSSRGATNSHDILAAEAHERALSLAVGSVARRPGHQAASAAANGGSAYQVVKRILLRCRVGSFSFSLV